MTLDNNYDYMVIDNEAGMEHISRETIVDVDILLVISDATTKGVRTAGRIYNLAKSLKIEIGAAYLVVSRIDKLDLLENEIEATGLDLLGLIPNDPLITEYDLRGKPLKDLPADSLAVSASMKLFEKLRL
jgi:CO dehydrogenase maturation factor